MISWKKWLSGILFSTRFLPTWMSRRAVAEIVEVDLGSPVGRERTGSPGAWSPRHVYSDQSRAPTASSSTDATHSGIEQ